ncbi:MAG: PQQ-like beta-propeller repeat protein [Planctomycetota bacterium]|nr:PQQ-like beta-propeller repeat protein [Planctomycetota bacterium]
MGRSKMTRLGVAMGLLGLIASMASAADWPQFQGPDRNGISPETGLLHAFPEGGPKVLWTVTLGEGYGAPVIRDGKVYLLDRQENQREVMRCWDLASGKEEWSAQYDAPGEVDHNGSRGSPSVDDKYVFSVGVFGDFVCFSRAGHKILWQKNILKDFGGNKPGWAVAQSPLLYKNWVIVAPQSPTAGVAALEKATGKVVWQSKTMGKMDYSSPLVTQVAGQDQIVMENGSRVVGIDPANGEILWTYEGLPVKVAQVPPPTPIGDGRFFVSGGYDAGCAMFKVEKKDGKFAVTELFKNMNCNSHIHNMILYKGFLYASCNTNSKRDGLVCLDLDGNVKWKTGKSPNFDKGNFIFADGVMYIMDGAGGQLRIVDPTPDGYKQLAEAKLLAGKEIWAPMALSNGKLVCRDQRQMKCVDLAAAK